MVQGRSTRGPGRSPTDDYLVSNVSNVSGYFLWENILVNKMIALTYWIGEGPWTWTGDGPTWLAGNQLEPRKKNNFKELQKKKAGMKGGERDATSPGQSLESSTFLYVTFN